MGRVSEALTKIRQPQPIAGGARQRTNARSEASGQAVDKVFLAAASTRTGMGLGSGEAFWARQWTGLFW